MKKFTPEERRDTQPGEIEIMKGRGSCQTWFYVTTAKHAKTLVRLGRGYCFPTGITNNNSKEDVDAGFYIQKTEEENESL